jgi:hypothetical protein
MRTGCQPIKRITVNNSHVDLRPLKALTDKSSQRVVEEQIKYYNLHN